MLRHPGITLALGLVATAAACSSPKPTKPVPAPIANIAALGGGVVIGQSVQLDGSGSTDPQNRDIRFGWEMTVRPGGSDAVLTGADTATPSFTPDVVGSYQVRLVVTNAVGVDSAPAYVSIAADTCGSLQLATPVASVTTIADPQQGAINGRPNVGSLVTLAATANDPNTACGSLASPERFEWAILSAPGGSHAQLSSSQAETPSFSPDVQGTYELAVTVTDALGNASDGPGILDVATTTCGANRPVVAVNPAAPTPFSRQSVPLTAAVSTPATDAGSAQACPARFSGQTYSVSWAIVSSPAGSSASLSSSSGLATSFFAPTGGTYLVHASATDSNGLVSDPATSTITVSSCGSQAPQILAVAILSNGNVVSQPSVGQNVDVVVAAADPDAACGVGTAGVVLYRFEAISLPPGSTAPASFSSSSPTFNFTPDVYGTFSWSLTVVDDSGLVSAPVTVTVQTAACAPGIPPLISSNPFPVMGNVVAMSTMSPVTDACIANPSFSYAWTVLQAPAGSQPGLSPAGSTASFLPDRSGVYVVQLTVTDTAGFSASRTLTLSVSSCGSAPPVVAGLVANPPLPDLGTLVTLSAPSITDPNGGTCGVSMTPYSYQWTLLSSPLGSAAVLDSTTSPSVHFVADKAASTWIFALRVTDAIGNVSDPVFLNVSSSSCGAHPPTVVTAPTGMPSFTMFQALSVNSGIPLQMTRTQDGTGDLTFFGGALVPQVPLYPGAPVAMQTTVDPGADACTPVKTISYQWSIAAQPAGSAAHIDNPTEASPGFIPDLPGVYQFRLTLSDQYGHTSVTGLRALNAPVGTCGTNAPVVIAGASAPIPSGLTATEPLGIRTDLDASGSSSPDGVLFPAGCGLDRTLSYHWEMTSLPPGSTAQLSSATASNPSFTPDLAGTYLASVTVSDGPHEASKTVSVSGIPGYVSTASPAPGASFTAVAADASGKPVVAWWDNASGTVAAARCTANCSTSTPVWASMGTIDSGLGHPLTFPVSDEPRPIAIAVNGADTWVAYFTSTGASPSTGAHGAGTCSVAIAHHDGTSWVSWVTPHGGFTSCTAAGTPPYSFFEYGRWVSLSTRAGLPVMAYWSVVGTNVTEPEITTCSDAACVSNGSIAFESAVPGKRSGKWSSIAVEPSGVNDIAYHVDDDGSGNAGLRFATNLSGTYTITTVESSASTDLGRFVSLAQSSTTPSIALVYRDATAKTARFARCLESGGSCLFGAPAAIPDAASNDYGRNAVIAADASGVFRVGYFDAQNAKIRILATREGTVFGKSAELAAGAPSGTPLGLSLSAGGGTHAAFTAAPAGSISVYSGP